MPGARVTAICGEGLWTVLLELVAPALLNQAELVALYFGLASLAVWCDSVLIGLNY